MIFEKYDIKNKLSSHLNYILVTSLLDGLKGDEVWEIFSDAMKEAKEEVKTIKKNTSTR